MYVDVVWTEGSKVSGTERLRDEHSSLTGTIGESRARYSRETIGTVVHRELRSAKEAACDHSKGGARFRALGVGATSRAVS